ncbi:hypothetical protein V3331_16355 [Gaopeijia maritima]|uniref:hypothetical protein n=1 Tax=Gaopeijia maritima TaxID=3119007 RepID=UPI0032522ABC
MLEIDPALKRSLYSLLDREELTLKEWFLDRAEQYIRDGSFQLRFEGGEWQEAPRVDGGY